VKILVVFCHPVRESFAHALLDRCVADLRRAGHEVTVKDLYAEGFTPALTTEERRNYEEVGRNQQGVAGEVEALKAARGLLLIYPTWWYGMPAMLKGWFDRIWVLGVAFRLDGAGGLQPLLTNVRRIGVLTTYGSPRWLHWFIGWPDWRMVRYGFRPLCARRCRLEWISLARMDSCTAQQRERFLTRVRTRLSRW